MDYYERIQSGVFERVQLEDLDIHFFSIGRRKCVPLYSGWKIKASHQYVIHFNLNGRAILRYNQQKVVLEKNDIFVFFPNQVYQFTADSKDPLEYVWLSISGEGVDWLMDHSIVTIDSPFARSNSKIGEMFLDMIRDEDTSCSGMLVRHQKLYELLSFLVDKDAVNHPRHHTYQISEEKSNYLIDAIDYITKNFKKKIAINELAERLYISRDYLFKLFVKNTGMSPSQFITVYRLNYCLQMLANKDLTISQISTMTGFCDVYHFSRTFKKIYGKSPTQYRKELLK